MNDNITINIEDYLNEEERREIIVDAFRANAVKHFSTEQDTERILSNMGYGYVSKIVDDIIDGDLETIIRDKVKNIVESLSSFEVFRKPDAWDREPNKAYTFMQNEIQSHFPEIKEVVASQIEPQAILLLKEGLEIHIENAVREIFMEAK